MKHAPYINLITEMQQRGIESCDIAELLKTNSSTVEKKINGAMRMNADEAVEIWKKIFPDCKLEYLFSSKPREMRK